MNKYGIIKNKWIMNRFETLEQAKRALKFRQSIERVEARAGKIIKLTSRNRIAKMAIQ